MSFWRYVSRWARPPEEYHEDRALRRELRGTTFREQFRLGMVALYSISAENRHKATAELAGSTDQCVFGLPLVVNQYCLSKVGLRSRAWPATRLLATESLSKQSVLGKIAIRDKSRDVRLAAIKHFAQSSDPDQRILGRIAIRAKDERIRTIATLLLTDVGLLARIAATDKDSGVRRAVIAALKDQSAIAVISRRDKDWEVRQAAVAKLTDETALGVVARGDSHDTVRKEAAERITDQPMLERIALEDKYWLVRCVATRKLTSQAILAKIALADDDEHVLCGAITKIVDQNVLAQLLAKLAAEDKGSAQVGLAALKRGNVRGAAIKRLNELREVARG
jgi:hypothetical protein